MAAPDADADVDAQQAPTSSVDPARQRALLTAVAAAAPFLVPTITGEADGVLETSPPPGTRADRPDLHPDPDDLIVAVGAGLQSLHGLAVSPFLADGQEPSAADGWVTIAARCRAAVASGAVDPQQLPEPYRRYSAKNLLAMFLDGKPVDADDSIDVVLCQGRPNLAQFLVTNGTFSGFASMADAMVADRHYDLAVIHQSVQHVFGPEAVFRFYESYGQDPNVAKLEHYVLVSHLLGTAPTQDQTQAEV